MMPSEYFVLMPMTDANSTQNKKKINVFDVTNDNRRLMKIQFSRFPSKLKMSSILRVKTIHLGV